MKYLKKIRAVQAPIASIQLIISLTNLLKILKVYYHPTIHRATITQQFSISINLQPIILTTLTFTLLCHIIINKKKGAIKTALLMGIIIIGYLTLGFEGALTIAAILSSIILTEIKQLTYFTLIILSTYEVISLTYWAIILPISMKNDLLRELATLEYSIYYISSQITPLMTLLILYYWLITWIIKISLEEIKEKIIQKIRKEIIIKENENTSILKINWRIMLIISIIISVISSIYPYLPSINPNNSPVGVDIKAYTEMVKEIENDLSKVTIVANGSRPIILLLIYFIWKISSLNLIEVVKWMPLILNPMLVLSTFYLIDKTTNNREYATLSALITSMGIKITVNMYSYFLTNMLALSIIYVAIALLLDSIERRDRKELLISIMLASIAIFTHPWTFTQFYVALAFMAFIKLMKNRRLKSVDYEIMFLVITGVIDVLKEQFIGVGSVRAASGTIGRQPFILNIFNFWGNVIFAFRLLYGGFLSNPILMTLALIGIYRLEEKYAFHKYLKNLIFVSSIAFLIANGSLQSRLIFNLPIEILVAYTLYWISKLKIHKPIKIAVFIFTLTSTLNYMFKSLANLI